MEQRLFLRRNQSSHPKAPEFKLSLMPAEKGGEWVDVCGFWPSESGKGWSGRVEDAVEITATNAGTRRGGESRERREAPQADVQMEAGEEEGTRKKQWGDVAPIAYPDEEIKPEDIPF